MFRGVFPIVPTPFSKDGDVDLRSFERVVAHCLAADVDGLVYPANASEAFWLTREERMTLSERLIELGRSRVPVLIGVSSPTVEQAREYALSAQSNGASGILISVPKESLEDVVDFLQKALEGVTIPVVFQNAPGPLGAALDVGTIAEIVRRIPQIQYVKEEVMPSGQRIAQLVKATNGRVQGVFGGDGGRSILSELLHGAAGTMPAVEVIEAHVDLYRRYASGDLDGALDVFTSMLPILNMQRVFRWAVTKKVLVWRGLIECDFVRAPGPRLDTIDERELRALFDRVWKRIESGAREIMPRSAER